MIRNSRPLGRERIGRLASILVALGLTTAACGESREEKLRRMQGYEEGEEGRTVKDVEKIPPDPMRDSMAPVLDELYSGNRLPDVLESDEAEIVNEAYPYQLMAGALAQVQLKPGLEKEQRIRAIMVGVAEADAWVHREKARRNYAEYIEKVKYSFGDETKEAIMRAYAELRLLDYFSSEGADAAIAKLPADVKPTVEAMKAEYIGGQEEIWNKWMDIKMMARRRVGGDEPFRGVLRRIRKALGKEEPPPIAFEDAHDSVFQAWADSMVEDEEFFALVTGLEDLRDREEFKMDTHAQWFMQGSDKIPESAKGVKIDEELGFGVTREDLGGGYSEFVFVFSKKLKGDALKKAYLRSHVYRSLFTDYELLAGSGRDFEGGTVPDKYDQEYAYCGSGAAIEALIAGKADDYKWLEGLAVKEANSDELLNQAHDCIVERCKPDIMDPPKDDPINTEGPAPGSRNGFFGMLARYEELDIDMNAMRKKEEKSDAVKDAEALLKANPNKPE